jgi:hypothetical protein
MVYMGGSRKVSNGGIKQLHRSADNIITEINRHFTFAKQIILTFQKRSILLSDPIMNKNIEIGDGARFITRAFRNAGIESVRINPEIRWKSKAEENLLFMLNLGYEEKVCELNQYSFSNSFGFIIKPLVPGSFIESLIPGTYKHYTDENGYKGIMNNGIVYGSENNKRGFDGSFVFVTKLSLFPDEARNILFRPDELEKIPKRGNYVISFDLIDGPPICVEHLKSEPSLEGWIDGDLLLDHVNVRYIGKNPVRQITYKAA